MSLTRADQVFTVEFENHLAGAHGSDDVCVDVCNCIASDFKREAPAMRVSIVITEFLKVVGYLTVNIGQTHLAS
jgi:hypothetical protein